jgi:hypothetical protein
MPASAAQPGTRPPPQLGENHSRATGSNKACLVVNVINPRAFPVFLIREVIQ